MLSSSTGVMPRLAESASAPPSVDRLLDAQGEILDLIAASASLSDTLAKIAIVVERLAAPALCSILLLEGDGKRLRHGAAPSLSAGYIQAIDGVSIGPNVGSCGTAAFLGEPVIVRDIATDPLWADYRDLAAADGLRACWSLPIKNESGVVLGTFALYREEPSDPTADDWTVLRHMARLVGVALIQHRKEALVAENQARWLLAAEVAQIGTFDVDIETGVRIWSDLFKSILGLAPTAVPSRELFISAVYPDDRACVVAAYDGWCEPGGSNRSAFDYRITRADNGQLRWVNVVGCTVGDAQGRPMRRIGTCIDITDRKLAEERLRASETKIRRMQNQLQWAQRISSTGSALRDLRTGEAEWSEEACRIFDTYPPGTALTLSDLLAIMHPDDRAAMAARIDNPPAPGERRRSEFRIVRRDGEARWILWETEILQDAAGERTHRLSVFRDITELRAAEAQRQEAERQLYQAQKIEALGTLAGGIAHDLNNTLVPIIALTKLALRNLPPASAVGPDLQIVYEAGQRARDLVGQILAFSRKEAVGKESVDLASLVENSTNLLRASVPSTINIVHCLEGGSAIWGNRGQLHQVLANLVMNAAQAIGPHIGTITIEVAHAATAVGVPQGAGRAVRLSVIDNGCGMDDKTAERIFEPFFTTKEVGQGTGLGLSVAHGIIAGHAGRVEVKSRLGEGSRFDIYFARHRPAPASAVEAGVSRPA